MIYGRKNDGKQKQKRIFRTTDVLDSRRADAFERGHDVGLRNARTPLIPKQKNIHPTGSTKRLSGGSLLCEKIGEKKRLFSKKD